MGAACFKEQATSDKFVDVRTAAVQGDGQRAGQGAAARNVGTGSPFSGPPQVVGVQAVSSGAGVIAVKTATGAGLEGDAASPFLDGSQPSPATQLQDAAASTTRPLSELSNTTSGTSGEPPKIQPSGFQTLSPDSLANEVAQLSWVGHGGYGAVYKGIWQARIGPCIADLVPTAWCFLLALAARHGSHGIELSGVPHHP